MPTAFIITESNIFTSLLRQALPSDWNIQHVAEGATAAGQMRDLNPDALILNPDPLRNTSIASKHLDALAVRPNLSGYRCLLTAIELFSQDRCLLLKEIYPEVAQQCSLNDGKCVEHVIRTAIRDAWNHRNKEIWDFYFPGRTHCPSNKEFIAILAKML